MYFSGPQERAARKKKHGGTIVWASWRGKKTSAEKGWRPSLPWHLNGPTEQKSSGSPPNDLKSGQFSPICLSTPSCLLSVLLTKLTLGPQGSSLGFHYCPSTSPFSAKLPKWTLRHRSHYITQLLTSPQWLPTPLRIKSNSAPKSSIIWAMPPSPAPSDPVSIHLHLSHIRLLLTLVSPFSLYVSSF